MDFFAGIKTYIYILSSCILYPVLLLLAGLSVWIFYECGKFFAFWLERRRDPDPVSRPVREYLGELENQLSKTTHEEDIQNLLRKRIQERLASLDKYLIAARIGPALGLIGTLVPMGTALAGLGQGDFSVMTSELVLAYTTTVVGLMIGSLSYLISTLRRRYAENDIREMEFLTEKMYHEVHALRQ